MTNIPFPQGSLLFAPMEGITDESYRLALHQAFPEWDNYSTDFLRIPTQGHITDKKLLSHFGERVLKNKEISNQTTYQVLTTARAQTKQTVEQLDRLGFKHLDLNLGCPSKRVNAHHGGAYLLSDLPALKIIIKDIRETFNGFFSVKIRVGYKDDSKFLEMLKLFQDEGVEAITIHARTRDQLYKGVADWSYIARAVEILDIPVIGNGDVWTMKDIKKMFKETGCHSIMLGRGALKTPWMASWYREFESDIDYIEDEDLLSKRKDLIELYFYMLIREYQKVLDSSNFLLRRFKSFSHYLFDDYPQAEEIRGHFLRSESMDQFLDNLKYLQ